MANLDNFVQVTVTKTSASVSRQGFGVPLWCGQVSTSVIPTRYAEYSSLTEMTDAGHLVTDRAYLWAERVAAQDPGPTKWAIGRRGTGTAQVDTVTITTEDDGVWSITIDGQVFSFTASTNTEQEIAEGLRDAVLAHDADTSNDGTAVTVQTGALPGGTFTVTAWVPGETFANGGIVVPGGGVGTFVNTVANVAAENLTTALNAIIVENNDWYRLNIESRQQTDIELANTWVATQLKVLTVQNGDQDVLTTTPGNIALDLAATNNKSNYFIWYHRPKEFMDGAITGHVAGYNLDAAGGNGTWAIQQVVGPVPSPLTSAEVNGAAASGADTYTETGGRGTTLNGRSVEGEFMDVQVSLDWVSSRMKEDIFAAMSTTPGGLGFTDADIAIIEGVALGRLRIGVTNGHFTGDDPRFPRVTVPANVDISTADKNARILRNVLGEAKLQGFMHQVIAQINVIV